MDSRVFKKAVDANTEEIKKFKEVFVSHQDLFSRVQLPADAASGTFEKTVFTAPYNCIVKDVKVVPDGNIGQATNYMTLDVQNKGAAGTGTTSLGTRAVNSTNPISGFVGADLVSTDAEVTEGQSITLKKTVTGDGQAFPGGLVIVRYEKA
jgi:hypothetical protein